MGFYVWRKRWGDREIWYGLSFLVCEELCIRYLFLKIYFVRDGNYYLYYLDLENED